MAWQEHHLSIQHPAPNDRICTVRNRGKVHVANHLVDGFDPAIPSLNVHHVQNFTDVYGMGASTAFPSTADFPSAIMTVLYKKSTNHPQETKYPEMARLRLLNPVGVCLGLRGESRSLAVPDTLEIVELLQPRKTFGGRKVR